MYAEDLRGRRAASATTRWPRSSRASTPPATARPSSSSTRCRGSGRTSSTVEAAGRRATTRCSTPTARKSPSQVEDGEIRFTADVAVDGLRDLPAGRTKTAAARSEPSSRSARTALENQFYKIELDGKGVIKSHHRQGDRPRGAAGGRAREPAPALRGQAQRLATPGTSTSSTTTSARTSPTSQSIEVVESGPVCGAVEMTRKFGKSKIKQRMVIYADIPRIDFETWVDWHEDDKCLKASFPVDVNATKARYEIQFGNVERPTHTNTSWDFARFEVCAHKWADISEGGLRREPDERLQVRPPHQGQRDAPHAAALAQGPRSRGRHGRARVHLLADAARGRLHRGRDRPPGLRAERAAACVVAKPSEGRACRRRSRSSRSMPRTWCWRP